MKRMKSANSTARRLVSTLCAFAAIGQCMPYSAAAEAEFVVYENLRLIEYSNGFVLDGVTDTSVTSVYIPAEINGKPVRANNTLFRDCPYLTEITVDEENKQLSAADGVLFSQNGQRLLAYPRAKEGEYTLPDSVLFIADKAFEKASGLTELTISDSLLNVGMSAFVNCTGLTEIHGAVPFTYGDVFAGCTSLKSLELAEFGDASGSVELVQLSLVDCLSLETVIIPDCRILSADVWIMRCPKLKMLNLPTLADHPGTSYITIIGCDALTTLNLPAAATYIEGPCYTIQDCANLYTIRFSKGYLAGVEIEGCSALTKAIYLTGDQNRNESLFSGCEALTVYGLSSDIQLRNDCERQDILFVPLDTIAGDVNIDTEADISDAVLLARYIAEDRTANIPSAGQANADVNGDGLITHEDVTYLLRIIAKLV